MKLYTPNFIEMDKLVEQGYLKKVIFPCRKLVLFDYTDKCTYERKWTNHTLNNRGNVYEISTGKIVARSFPKFFNWSEHNKEDQKRFLSCNSFTTSTKKDGSLGVVYFYNGEWRVNTRGSFTSEQAIKGKSLLRRVSVDRLDKDQTYLVEILYPENRIVVDYNGYEGLCLLASFNTQTGKEVFYIKPSKDLTLLFHCEAEVECFNSIQEVISKLDTLPYNEEGYVVRFSNGERVKFKGKEYIEMHRIITNTSPLSLWENMSKGRVDRKLLESIPEEFLDKYINIAKTLEDKYLEILNEATDTTNSIAKICNDNRKEIGLYLSKNNIEYSQLVFPIFLEKFEHIEKIIMQKIRPTGNII